MADSNGDVKPRVSPRLRGCSECEELRAKLKRAVIVIEALKSRVLDLETSMARRGAVGGRQCLGETVEDQVQQQMDRKDEEVKTMREAVIELSTQVAEKEAQLALNQERLADFVNARATAAPKSSPSEVPRHYPGGWQPPGSGATGAMGAMGAMSTSLPEARKAEALGQEMWELQRLRMQQLSRQMEDKVEAHRATSLDALESQWSQWILRATDSLVFGMLHVTAQSDEAGKVLQLPGRSGGPRLAMVDKDAGLGVVLRLFASQGDKTPALELHSECSRARENEQEFSFEIFGFGGRQRSAPGERADLTIECKKLQTTSPQEQFFKWRDALMRCGLLDAAANKKRVECNVCGLVMGRVGRSLQQ